MMISPIDVLVAFFLLTFLVLPTGYLASRIFFSKWHQAQYMVPFIMISMMLGTILVIPIWWTLGLLSYNIITLIIVPLASLAIILISTRKSLSKESIASVFSSAKTDANKFFLVLSLISFGYIVFTTLTLAWAEPGDPWAHSVFVTLIIQNGKIPSSFLPLVSHGIHYPVAYHTLAASLWLLAGLVPGKGLLLVASFSLAMIPIISSWWCYARTESYLAALISFVFTFFYSNLSVELSLWGYYFNGSYTILTACFIPVISILLIDKTTRGIDSIDLKTLSFLVMLCYIAFITYPVFILVPGFIIVMIMIQKVFFGDGLKSKLTLRAPNTSEVLFIICSILIAVFVLYLYVYTDYLYYIHLLFIGSGNESQVGQLHNYYLEPAYFLDPFVFLISCSLFIASLLGLSKNSKSLFFIAITVFQIVCYLSIIPIIHDSFLFILQPQRFLMLISILAFVLTPEAFRKVKQKISDRDERWEIIVIKKWNLTRIKILSIIVLIISCIFISPSIVSHFSGAYAIRAGSFQNSEAWKNDAAGIQWMVENIDENDLILNFQTYSDFYIPSFGLLNVVYARPTNETLGLALYNVWNSTNNETLVYSLLQEYGIDYIYLAGYWAMIDIVHYIYHAQLRPYFVSNYTSYFNSYDFLQIRFHKGACIVYEVVGL